MTDDDRFFERLRGDAAPLRYQVSEAELTRIRARIHERIAKPGVADVLAAWFRPLAAGLAAVALAAAISLAMVGAEEDIAIEVAGETYVVSD
jgi:hypothetical protein